MKISRITKQKRSDRYNIFITVDNKEFFGFGVDEDILVQHHLHKGMSLSDELVETLKRLDHLNKFYRQAINYLSYRMRSRLEVVQYLRRKEVEPTHLTEIVSRLEIEGLIDDREFAFAFVRQRINQSTKGPQFVKQELTQKKGIANHIATEAIEQYTFSIQFDQAMKAAQRHIRRESKDSIQKRLQKLQAALIRNGFYTDVIKEVIQESEQRMREEHDEERAIKKHGERLLQKHRKKLNGRELAEKVMEGLYRQGFSFEQINQFMSKYVR